jgi:hypothetical protein
MLPAPPEANRRQRPEKRSHEEISKYVVSPIEFDKMREALGLSGDEVCRLMWSYYMHDDEPYPEGWAERLGVRLEP